MYCMNGAGVYEKMNRLSDTTDGPDGAESDPEDPEQLLNDLLGELDNLAGVCIHIGNFPANLQCLHYIEISLLHMERFSALLQPTAQFVISEGGSYTWIIR
ncbi:uncharacterized protein LOC109538667 [Dendroctonus ponderosae]|uniref:uncharacterized protein LOC109538667 n=1 Tax=Dendroctonus ponderosae TaxID=77166 RepID=UPI002034C5F6|nr:uncharacterized protein LOC109538667 [Dendroctonus ponderosae]